MVLGASNDEVKAATTRPVASSGDLPVIVTCRL
jgi:hypothetical protein